MVDFSEYVIGLPFILMDGSNVVKIYNKDN